MTLNEWHEPYDVCQIKIYFYDESETPWLYPLALNGRVIKDVFLGGKHYVPERTCRIESKIFIEGEYVPCPYYEYEMECGGRFRLDDSEPPNFCPNCGARIMKEGGDD